MSAAECNVKGLDYVAVNPGIASDPKVVRMAVALRKDRHHIAGRFPEFFGKVAEHSVSGCLADVTDDTLDIWAGGLAGFGRLVRELMCDATGTLTAWWQYNGKALAKLQQDRERKKRKASGTSTEIPRNRSIYMEESPAPFRAGSADLTDTDTDTGKAAAAGAPSRTELEPLVRAVLLPESLEALDRTLRGSGNPDGIVNDLARRLAVHEKLIPTGPNGRGSDPRDVSAALIDLANGDRPTWNPRYFSGIVDKARDRREGGDRTGKPSRRATPSEAVFEIGRRQAAARAAAGEPAS